MLIVLDYDDTYTASPALWDGFIASAKSHGATIVCCTLRRSCDRLDNDDVLTDMARHDIEIVFAADHPSKWDAMIAAGYMPENAIWIDDQPLHIFNKKVSPIAS